MVVSVKQDGDPFIFMFLTGVSVYTRLILPQGAGDPPVEKVICLISFTFLVLLYSQMIFHPLLYEIFKV